MVEIGVGTCARKESSRTHSSLLGMASEIQSLTAAYFLPTLMRSRTGSSSNSLRLCERSPESYLAINNESWNTVGHGRLIPLIIIDTTNRPDLTEAIEAQVHLPAGDVVVHGARCPNATIASPSFSSFNARLSVRPLSSSRSSSKVFLSSTSFNRTGSISRRAKSVTA